MSSRRMNSSASRFCSARASGRAQPSYWTTQTGNRSSNFATLLMGSDDKLWANWHCENGLAASYPLA